MRVKKYDEKSKIYTLHTKNPEDNKESAESIEAPKDEVSDRISIQVRLLYSQSQNVFGEISVGINDPVSSLNNIIKI
jgi:hypothetical protein